MRSVGTMMQRELSRSSVTERTSQRVFFGVAMLLFAISAAATIHWCAGMSMGDMPMPGGWTMSMAWMRMPEQTWLGAATSFVAMWVVMMVAMMLPSLTLMLWRHYQVAGQLVDQVVGNAIGQTSGKTRVARLTAQLTAVVALGYFFVWAVLGMVAFPIGVALAEIEMQSPALARVVPIAASIVVLIAGALQFTAWKAARLACCREAPRCHLVPANIITAWRYGLRLGVHCSCCCVGLTAILFVFGVMNLRAMAVVTTAITVERLAPTVSVARIIGIIVTGVGLLMLARAAALV